MEVIFDKSFNKSIKKLNQKKIASEVMAFIEKRESAKNIKGIYGTKEFKKLTNHKTYYRFKLSTYRVL